MIYLTRIGSNLLPPYTVTDNKVGERFGFIKIKIKENLELVIKGTFKIGQGRLLKLHQQFASRIRSKINISGNYAIQLPFSTHDIT